MNSNTFKPVRVIAAILLFTMVYYIAGYRMVYFALTFNARNEASAVLNNRYTSHGASAVLQHLSLSEDEFNKLSWTEGSKEFSYSGQLYDVKSFCKLNGKYTILAYPDKNETKWVKALNNFMKQLFPAHNKPGKNPESFVSAFQKEYMPLNVVSIGNHAFTCIKLYSYTVNITSLCPDDGTWHPPSC